MTYQMIFDYYMVVVCSNVCRMLPVKIQTLKKSRFTAIFCNYLLNNLQLFIELFIICQKQQW